MDFRQLEAFCAIIDWGSFSKAAKKLFITQPTISNHLRSLEEELGTTLIARTTKTLTVTADGQRFYDYARNMLKIRDKALEEFNRSCSDRIHLGASSVPSACLLPGIMKGYKAEHPGVFFEILQEDSVGIINKVLDGVVDVGITGAPHSDDDLECLPVFEDEMILVTPDNEYFRELRARAQIDNGDTAGPDKEIKYDLREILLEPFIMREEGSATRRETLKYLQTIGITESQLNVCARINDLKALISSVAGGLGISVLSKAVTETMGRESILTYPLESDEGPVTRKYYVLYRKNQQNGGIQEFVRYIMKNKIILKTGE